MRRFFLTLALLLLASSTQAQDAGAFAKRTAMLAAGTGASLWTASVAAESNEAAIALLAPLTAALGVYGMGRILGAEGKFGGTLGGAALGAIPGAALLLVGVAQLSDTNCGDPILCGGEAAGPLIFGAVLYLAGPPIGALVGFGSVEPVVGSADLGVGFHVRTAGLRLTF